MGHVVEKYDPAYFLGAVDEATGRTYGVRGHAHFREGTIHPMLLEEIDFTSSMTGPLREKHVLDIGFGRGDSIPAFLELGVASYTGIDFSRTAVDIARSRHHDPRVHLRQMEAVDLDSEREFDLVIGYDVLEHIPAHEMDVVWKNIHRSLRPGGYIAITTPVFPSPNAGDHTEQNPSVMGMHCNKQTCGTLIRACLKHRFVVARFDGRLLGMVRADDLPLFSKSQQEAYRTAHAQLLSRCGVDCFTTEMTPELEQRLVPGAGRVAVGCVADNQPKFLSQALRLVQSIRWFGGGMAGANCFVCVVDECDPEYANEFQRLGAFVRTVPRFDSQHGFSNKLRFLELPELEAYDTVVLLDCDTVVVQDPETFLNGKTFQAKIADLPTVPHEVFERLFEEFDLPLPLQEYRCQPGGQPTIPYCNAGVLAFPKAIFPRLRQAWLKYNKALLERRELLGDRTMFCDQASLVLALSAEQVPFEELPLGMNFPLHLTYLPPNESMQQCDPIILHYHDRIDATGYLQASPYHGAEKRIRLFNQRLQQERRRRFHNRLFWDFRYSHAPELGSGSGSRDEMAAYKQQLLGKLAGTHQPRTVLDLGCGDHVAAKDFPSQGYTGVDVSSVVIERNRTDYPDHRFLQGDLLTLDCPRSDMLLSLDVLIHVSSVESYRAMVRRIVELTGKVAFVSGYEAPPPIDHHITFYHEPLSESLREAGARNLRKEGAYGNVTVWSFEPPAGRSSKDDVPRHSAKRQTTEQQSRYAEPKVHAKELHQPVFLTGCMRSGTTLLATLLGRFDGIVYCPFELKNLWSRVGGVPMASPKTRDTCCPELGADEVWEGQADQLARAFLAEMDEHNTHKNAERPVFLNKNPHLCNKLPLVRAMFPDAQFIWIHRALPPTVASLKQLFEDVCGRQQTWHYWPKSRKGTRTRCWEAFHFQPPPDNVDPARCFPGGKVHCLAQYWLESNRAVARFLQHLPDGHTLVIREEDLIERPRIEIARCLAFLGLPLEDISQLEDEVDRSRNDLWTSRLTPEEHVELLNYLESHAHDVEQVFPNAKESTRSMILDSLNRRVSEQSTFTGTFETSTPPLGNVKKRA